jgi:hypothetical protein
MFPNQQSTGTRKLLYASDLTRRRQPTRSCGKAVTAHVAIWRQTSIKQNKHRKSKYVVYETGICTVVWPYFHTLFYACYTRSCAFSSHVLGFHDGFLLLSPFILTLQSIYSTPLSLLTPFPHLSFVILTLQLHIFATHLLHSITTVQCNNRMCWYAIIGRNTSGRANLVISLHHVQIICLKTWPIPVDITKDQMENSPASFVQQLFVFGICSFETWLRSDNSHCTLSSCHCILRKITSTVDIASLCKLRSSK